MTRAMLSLVLFGIACDAKTEVKNDAVPAKHDEGKPHGIDADTAKKLADAAKALQGLGREYRGAFAGAALAELEVGRLPRQLTEAMAELQNVPPESRNVVAMKALTDPALLTPLQALCDGKATVVLGSVAQVAADQKIALVWDGCALERAGLLERAVAERSAIGPLLLGYVAHRVLVDKGGASPDELVLLRAFATG